MLKLASPIRVTMLTVLIGVNNVYNTANIIKLMLFCSNLDYCYLVE